MKKVCILTATRAEYGLLKPIIEKMIHAEDIGVEIVVTGAHLSPEYGETYKEIEADGFHIGRKIDILLSGTSAASVSKSMGLAMIGFGDYFETSRPDMLIVLGDRYETFAVCAAATNARIPIIHLYGGETTEGAVDEAYRHSITKMSHLHFTSTEQYRDRVIQLGENPENVYNVGAIGVENALKATLFSKKEIYEQLNLQGQAKYAVVTFHPVTLENATAEQQVMELLGALERRGELVYIITKANADAGGALINHVLDEYAATHSGVKVFSSLGMKRYLSALKYSTMVIGNSSSGIVEAPTFHIPTVNIGDRQKGRMQAQSVINCEPLCADISAAIETAEHFDCSQIMNPYGKGNTSDTICKIIAQKIQAGSIDIKKKFYDLEKQR